MRLNQVTAPAIDLDRSIAFYVTLGLRLIVKSPYYARFELPQGEATFSLHVVDGPVARERAPQPYFEAQTSAPRCEGSRTPASSSRVRRRNKLGCGRKLGFATPQATAFACSTLARTAATRRGA
ncbi:MAG: VOC family protein [Hyphomonadaceae bacterium]|nr:VOC family protein [Hyphomonadaceae bacterium]